MAKSANDIVVTHIARTAFDKYGGELRNSITYHMLAELYLELLKRSGLKYEQINEINNGSGVLLEIAYKGNVPARQALLRAGFPQNTLSNNINRACCSGTAALDISRLGMILGETEIAIASAGDNVGHTPYLFDPKRMRHDGFKVQDFVLRDQIADPVYQYKGFGDLAVETGELALEMGISKEMQDQWALDSHKKWAQADSKGFFNEEIFKLQIEHAGKTVTIQKDACPSPNITLEEIAAQPLLKGSATVSYGNSPGLNAGAAGLILMTRKKAEELGYKPLAKISTVVNYADDQKNSALSPAAAITKGLAIAGVKLDQLDLLEINETMAAFPLISTKKLANGDEGLWKKLQSITNVNGGAVAIGHPVAASGLRITLTLIRELLARGGKYGAASICGGIGQCDAVIVEAE